MLTASEPWIPRDQRVLLVVLAANAVVWTIIACFGHANIHHDVTESYAWGQEFRLGYYKHPPLTAWLVGAWFAVMPHEDWAMHLLTQITTGVGVLGVSAVAGEWLDRRQRWLVIAATLLSPYFTVMAMKLNPNTILLALWPWTVFAFLRTMERRPLGWAVAFGFICALSFYGKYYSAVLLMSLAAASLIHPNAVSYFRSPRPYVALLVCCLTLLPHLDWMVRSDFQTLAYAESKTRAPLLAILPRAIGAVTMSVLIAMPSLLLVYWGTATPLIKALRAYMLRLGSVPHRWLAIVLAGPLLLTFAACLFGNLRISLAFFIPDFFLIPIAALHLAPGSLVDAIRLRRIAYCVGGIWIAALVLIVPIMRTAIDHDAVYMWQEPRREAAETGARLWNEHIKFPLRIVAGSETLMHAAAFYLPSSPSEFTFFDYAKAPWITPDRIAKQGLLSICFASDTQCIEHARLHSAPGTREQTISMTHTFLGRVSKPQAIVFRLVPPYPANSDHK